MNTFDDQPCDIDGNPISYKMKIETYYGTVTESKAQSIVRDINLNKHEADDSFYTYEPSSKFVGLFCIVKYTDYEHEFFYEEPSWCQF